MMEQHVGRMRYNFVKLILGVTTENIWLHMQAAGVKRFPFEGEFVEYVCAGTTLHNLECAERI